MEVCEPNHVHTDQHQALVPYMSHDPEIAVSHAQNQLGQKSDTAETRTEVSKTDHVDNSQQQALVAFMTREQTAEVSSLLARYNEAMACA